jgi:hypothetical protein
MRESKNLSLIRDIADSIRSLDTKVGRLGLTIVVLLGALLNRTLPPLLVAVRANQRVIA